MRRVEDIIIDKIESLIHYVLAKLIKPDITIDTVTELDEKQIKEIKRKYEIEGIILDVDETLRKNMNDIPKVNQEWIEKLRGQLKVIILSNGKDGKLENYFKEKGIDYIAFAHKPLKKNYLKACQLLNLPTNKVMVVGDSIFDDIYGGQKNYMVTVLVKNVIDEERLI